MKEKKISSKDNNNFNDLNLDNEEEENEESWSENKIDIDEVNKNRPIVNKKK